MSFELRQLSTQLSPFTLAMSAASGLGPDERGLLEKIQDVRSVVKDGDTIIRTGDVIDKCFIVRSGWFARQRSSIDGQMVTTNVYLPGDILSGHLGFKRQSFFDVVALQKAEIATVDAKRLRDLANSHENIAAALDWSGVRDFNIVSEHIVGMSTKDSSQKVLHLLLELWCRLVVVGQSVDNSFGIPLSQKEIGEMVGLSLVSVNRAIQTLRHTKMVVFKQGKVTFADVAESMNFCDFDPEYLEVFNPLRHAELKYYLP